MKKKEKKSASSRARVRIPWVHYLPGSKVNGELLQVLSFWYVQFYQAFNLSLGRCNMMLQMSWLDIGLLIYQGVEFPRYLHKKGKPLNNMQPHFYFNFCYIYFVW